MVEKKRKREKTKQQHFLKRKRRQKMSASNETKALFRCSLTFFASSFFSESVVVLFFSLFLFFSTMRSFSFFFSFLFVHDTIHSADNNTAGQQILTNYPTQRKNERFVKHRDYPPHSYS